MSDDSESKKSICLTLSNPQEVSTNDGSKLLVFDGAITDRESCPNCTSGKKDGPAKVNSASYREGYDRIFGTKPEVGEA